MATPSVSNTLIDGQTIQPGPLNQNFSDIVTGLGSSGWDLTIGAMTIAGTLAVGGNTTLGNSASDTITLSGTVNSDIVPTSSSAYSLGTTTLPWKSVVIATLTSGSSAGTNALYGNTFAAAYGKIGSQATVLGGLNIADCQQVSTGLYSLTVNTGFNSTNFVLMGTPIATSPAYTLTGLQGTSAAFQVHIKASSGAAYADVPFSFVLYGN